MVERAAQARHVAIDTGGTFTDLCTSDGRRIKVPSNPSNPSAAVLGALAQLGDADTLQDIRHGTTVATNAVLERRGARVVLIATQGFGDVLALRRQARPDLYALHPSVPPPLIPQQDVVEVAGRLNAEGRELDPLEPLDAWVNRNRPVLARAEAFAVCLLHAYANGAHEAAVAAQLGAIFPDVPVVTSHGLIPLDREYERTSTTAVNAFVTPVMASYLGELERSVAPARLLVMGSAGGLMSAAAARTAPVHTVLSGPAGGVRGAWAAGQRCGRDALLTLDMGGTSTDVSVVYGELLPEDDGSIGDHPLRIPLLPIETVGAGGGSIAYRDAAGALKVGPRSAGADPGPAAYGRAGPDAEPTVTDANVVLERLPQLLGGAMPLASEAAHRAVQRLANALGTEPRDTAEAIVRVAEANMARACKRVTMERGIDPRTLTLVAFGGAAGLHACAVADELGCPEVLFPAEPGVLSAAGMLSAPREMTASQSLFLPQDEWASPELPEQLVAVLDKAAAQLRAEGVEEQNIQLRAVLDCRYAGQTFTLALELHTVLGCLDSGSLPERPRPLTDRLQRAERASVARALRQSFDAAHTERYGYALGPERDAELVAVRAFAKSGTDLEAPANTNPVVEHLAGPHVVSGYSATLYLPAGWSAERLASGDMLCRKQASSRRAAPPRQPQLTAAPLELEIHRQRLAAIAEEMGAALMRASFSANIKERRDFSCAIFDAQGRMLVQAAHIPVHLGSQPMSVDAALQAVAPQPEQAVILNDPYAGGTHLPDVTLVEGVYPADAASEPVFYVSNRAHHADVGGASPGSMPAARRSGMAAQTVTIDDEGFRIAPAVLTDALAETFARASRTPSERRGDLQAQRAANLVGIRQLRALAAELGDAALARLNQALLDHAERQMRQVIGGLEDGTYTFEDSLDDDGLGETPISIPVCLTIAGESATVDFTAAPDAVPSGLNAVRAITVSAVFYVFRTLGGSHLPANAGLMRPIRVLTRPGSILDAQPPAAVAAGNVETSQRIVDVLYGALARAAPNRIPAASCGSMNNVLFGGTTPAGQPFVHYETLAGGAGGSAGQRGAAAIHTHMTNTLNTPVEALEREFPIQVRRYAVRPPHSTAPGAGGAGIVREYRFASPATVTLMTERRRTAPYGLAGGEAGTPGRNTLLRRNGEVHRLSGKVTLDVATGDILRIETPAGGSHGG